MSASPSERIRPESPADRAAIHAVHAASFPTEAEARLVDALRDAGKLSLSIVAEIDASIVGHVAFSPVELAGAQDGAGLAPLAVVPLQRGRGVAERLTLTGLGLCREAGVGFVVVLGDPRYYARFGFRAASVRNLRDEFGGGEAFQVLELKPGALPAGGGLVRYADEFDVLGED